MIKRSSFLKQNKNKNLSNIIMVYKMFPTDFGCLLLKEEATTNGDLFFGEFEFICGDPISGDPA